MRRSRAGFSSFDVVMATMPWNGPPRVSQVDSRQPVAVTCVDTYTPIHIAKRLLDHNIRVRGSVEPQRLADINTAFRIMPQGQVNCLQLFPMKPMDEDLKWDQFLHGMDIVVHNVTPLPSGTRVRKHGTPRSNDEDIEQAMVVVKKMLAACVRAKRVKRIILLTSIATIAWHPSKSGNTKPFTEEDSEEESHLQGYGRCQLMAERYAQSFVNSLTESDKIDLVIINPGYVVGPIFGGVYSFTLEVILQLLGQDRKRVPDVNVPYVDVRDVAAAVHKCLHSSHVVGKRHIILSCVLPLESLLAILQREFTREGYNFRRRMSVGSSSSSDKAGRGCCWCLRRRKVNLGEMYHTMHGVTINYDTRRMNEVLEIYPQPIEVTIVEAAYSLIHWDYTEHMMTRKKLSE